MKAIQHANGVGAPSREAHLRDYWKIAWQGRWTAVAVFCATIGAVMAWTFLQTPIYRATAVVEVQPQARRVGPGQDVSGLGVGSYGWFAEDRYQNTQIEIIKSRGVTERAFALLGLQQDPRFADLTDPAASFAAAVKVEPRRETGLIEISIEGPNREETARWANAIADTYVEKNLERAKNNTRNAVASIESLMQPLKEKLSEAEQSRFEVLKEKQIYNPENQADIVRQRLTKLNSELSETEVKLSSLRSLLAKTQEIQESDGDPMVLPDLAKDAELQEYNRQKVAIEREVEIAKVTYLPGHPAYQAKATQLSKVQQRIRDRVSLILGAIRDDYELASRKDSYLRGEIRKAEEQSYQVGVATSQYSLVKTDAETRKQLYDVITKTLNEVTIASDLLANNVSVLDHATPPRFPVRPQKRLNLILSGIVGMSLGLAAVFFLDYLDNTFRTPEEIERHLQLGTLAVIPRYAEADVNSHAVKEAYQTLRTGLIFLSRNRERRVLLVTSSGPQEGKSSTVARLAGALASAGERVIVLDCDLRRPTQHLHLGLERDHGLTNHLSAPKDVGDWRPYVKQSSTPNLDVMTCGPIPPNPPELLGSDRFAVLLGDLRECYDWVVLDSPPAMSLADAALLTTRVDMVLLVIQHGKADRDLVSRSVAQFRGVGANLVGAVLNNVDIEKAYKGDYYYAGYYYYGADQKKRRRSRSSRSDERRSGTAAGA